MSEELKALLKQKDYLPQYEVSVGDRNISVPVVYPNVRAIMAFFPIAQASAIEIIKTSHCKPVSIFGGKCLVGITVFDYRESPVGPYRELALSIPVLLDPLLSIPLLPFIFESLFPTFGFYTVLLAMNTNGALEHSQEIFGYPTFSRNVDIFFEERDGVIAARAQEGNRDILSFSLKKPSHVDSARKKYLTYFLKDDKIISVAIETAAASASLGRGACRLVLGEHEIAQLLKNLSIDCMATESICYSDAMEILYPPKIEGKI